MSVLAPHDWLFRHAMRRPMAPAVDSPHARVSYSALARRVGAVVANLRTAGISPGERVLISLSNSAAAAVAALGVQAAGGCACEVSPSSGPETVAAAAAQVGARFAFVRERDSALWAQVPAARWFEKVIVVGGGSRPASLGSFGASQLETMTQSGELLRAEVPDRLEPAQREAHEPALVLFTSGSTAVPRGVVLSFGNLEANARAIAKYLSLGAEDRAMLILPLSYAYGRSVLHSHLLVGGSVYLDDRFMFPRVVLEAMSEERCTGFSGVPATFELLRRTVPSFRVSMSLRYVTQAGGAMSTDTVRWARAQFWPAKFFVMYGQTEATARLCYLPPEQGSTKEGSIGVPVENMELYVVDANANPLPDGQVGELVARGPGVALGYLDAPEEQMRTFRENWLFTGDVGYRDADGYFFLVDRAKELLKVGGYRVSPAQIESVLAADPGVLEAAVVGVVDPVEGEVPAAAVVQRPGHSISLDALRRRCRAQLSPTHVPRWVVAVDALPRNEVGKVLRREVARLIAARRPRGETG
ncbi:MAG: acyl--CoA ligase [Deltaproteobacteria bacterium]|nr:acyl--CoA ligase [Deltaproteobacteria bacterium]